MKNTQRSWLALGSALLTAAVILGAFGAHGLKERLDAYHMAVFEKGVFYQFVHSLGVLIVGTLPALGAVSQSAAMRICALFTAGIILFSGSLYLLALSGMRVFGAITPFGGVCFILGWGLLTWMLRREVQSTII